MTDNVIKLNTGFCDPEARTRSGRVILNFGIEDAEPYEIEGNITTAEALLMINLAQKWLLDKFS